MVDPFETKKGYIEIMSFQEQKIAGKLEFELAYAVDLTYHFNARRHDFPFEAHLVVRAGALRLNREVVYLQNWLRKDPFKVEQETVVSEDQDPLPKIKDIQWLCGTEAKNSVSEANYGDAFSLSAQITEAQGNSVRVSIAKKDGSEFENGKKSLEFSDVIDKEGYFELSAKEIKAQWEDFKASEDLVDVLVATIKHGEASAVSKELTIKPTPKVVVNFRPHANYSGEFGFDWLRVGDTELFGDHKYQDIVSKQYTDNKLTKLVMNGNTYNGIFKKDKALFEKLQKTYKTFQLPWKAKNKDTQKLENPTYYMPWLSLKEGETAHLQLLLDVKQPCDRIAFEKSEHFKFEPNSFELSPEKGKIITDAKAKPLEVKITCTCSFETDTDISILAIQDKCNGQEVRLEAGKIKAWANNASKFKEKKVVFVQVKTPEVVPLFGKRKVDASLESIRINNYLKQAFIELDKTSEIIDLDLTADEDFKKFISKPNIIPQTNNSEQLHNFLKQKLAKDFKNKYKDHFKAFYFAEAGGKTGGLSGYSMFHADFVIVFKSANDQTAAHEFLHAFNLAHSFTNQEAIASAEFTYEYSKTDNLLDYSHHVSGHKNSRCSLWYWQWKIANESIKNDK